jgi:hypothetical protein
MFWAKLYQLVGGIIFYISEFEDWLHGKILDFFLSLIPYEEDEK